MTPPKKIRVCSVRVWSQDQGKKQGAMARGREQGAGGNGQDQGQKQGAMARGREQGAGGRGRGQGAGVGWAGLRDRVMQ